MARGDFGAVVKGVEALFTVGTVAGLSDLQLLERFVGRSDDGAELAFAALVKRHGPMVLRVCRGELRDAHAAEDAFQATFLILARKARSIRQGGSLASWLYGVARRVARRARRDRARRTARERRGAAMAEDHALLQDDPPDLVPEIQEELDRLPEKYRAPIVLCYLEGLTHEEAASQLRVPVGTVKVRLSRGRERLRGRLIRRGLAPALIAAALAAPARAAAPTPLLNLTVKAAMQFAAVRAAGLAGISASVAALVQGVLRAMLLTKLKAIAALAAASLTLLVSSLLVVSAWSPPVRSDQEPQPRKGTEVRKVFAKALQPPPPAPKDKPGKVAVLTVKKSVFQRTTSQPGTVRAFNSVELYPQVSGVLVRLSVDIGDRVKTGQMLAQIDAPELEADVAKGRALLDRALARVHRMESAVRMAAAALASERAQVDAAEADVKSSEVNLGYRQKQLNRMRDLVRDRAVDQRLVEEQEGALHAAEAALAAAKAKLAVEKAGLGEAQAKTEAAQAELDEAKADYEVAQADLRKTQLLAGLRHVRSLLEGIVTRRNYHPGDFVRSPKDGDTIPLLTIVGTDIMRVIVPVPDRDVPWLDKGDPVTIHFAALQGREYRGVISRIAESEDIQDRTMRAEVDLPNPDHIIKDGMFGHVEIQLESRPNVIAIPLLAVLGEDYGTSGPVSCYRVVNGRAVRTPIKLADPFGSGSLVEVVEGLREGDMVVADWRGIEEGQVIRADQATPFKQSRLGRPGTADRVE